MFYIKHNMEMCICVICDVGHYQAESNSIYANVFLVIMLVFLWWKWNAPYMYGWAVLSVSASSDQWEVGISLPFIGTISTVFT